MSVVVDQVEQPHELVMFAHNYHIAVHARHTFTLLLEKDSSSKFCQKPFPHKLY